MHFDNSKNCELRNICNLGCKCDSGLQFKRTENCWSGNLRRINNLKCSRKSCIFYSFHRALIQFEYFVPIKIGIDQLSLEGLLFEEQNYVLIRKNTKLSFFGEFDPGSGWTLAARFRHASRATYPPQGGVRAADGWVTRRNLPRSGE